MEAVEARARREPSQAHSHPPVEHTLPFRKTHQKFHTVIHYILLNRT